MKKKTTLKTNIPAVADAFRNKFCDKSHDHVPITGADKGIPRAKFSQNYPATLVKTIADAVAMHLG